MVYYKVVRLKGEKKLSTSNALGYYTVEYKENVPVFPPIKWSYLFVFANLSDAKSFVDNQYHHKNFEIWECEADIDREAEIMRSIPIQALQFWRIYNSIRKYATLSINSLSIVNDDEAITVIINEPIIKATLFARSVTLLRKVENALL